MQQEKLVADNGRWRPAQEESAAEGLETELVDEPITHPAHERGKTHAGTPVVEGLVRHVAAMLVLERAQ